MRNIWLSVIISFFTSLIVSSITFVFGLRSGKNQVDRLKLKDIYKELYNYFDELLSRLDVFNPKQLCDFPEDRKKSMYIATMRRLKEEGSLLELPDDFSQELENLELKYLRFSHNFFKILMNHKSFIIELLKKYSICLRELKNSITSIDKDRKNSYFEESFGSILNESEVDKICSRLNNNNELGICLFLKDCDNIFRFYIYSNSLKNLSVSDFILELSSSFLKLPDVKKVLEERKDIIELINKMLSVLKKRAIDPHPFWITIKMTILDIFKGK